MNLMEWLNTFKGVADLKKVVFGWCDAWYREKLPELRKDVFNLEDYILKTEAEKDKELLRIDNGRLNEDKQSLTNQLSSKTTYIEQLEKERDDYKGKWEIECAEKGKLLVEKGQLDTEIKKFGTTIENLRDDGTKKQQRIDSLEKDNESLETQHRDDERRIAELEPYEKSYKHCDDMYRGFVALSAILKDQLQRIIGSAATPSQFLFSLANKDVLLELGNWAEQIINNKQGSEAERQYLMTLFEFSLMAVNSGRKKIYNELRPSEHSKVNSDIMTLTSDSKQLGVVTTVLLPGLRNSENNTLVRKALVFVKE